MNGITKEQKDFKKKEKKSHEVSPEAKVCFRCKQYIPDDGGYYSFTEFSHGKRVKVDYAHKICWDNFLAKIGDVTEARGMLRGLKKTLTKMGMLPPDEVVIES